MPVVLQEKCACSVLRSVFIRAAAQIRPAPGAPNVLSHWLSEVLCSLVKYRLDYSGQSSRV